MFYYIYTMLKLNDEDITRLLIQNLEDTLLWELKENTNWTEIEISYCTLTRLLTEWTESMKTRSRIATVRHPLFIPASIVFQLIRSVPLQGHRGLQHKGIRQQ